MKPSFRFVSFLKQIGNVATPDCFSTLALLGAVSSFSTVHLALPLPVSVALQPVGALPMGELSKLSTLPDSIRAIRVAAIKTNNIFIGTSIYQTSSGGRMCRNLRYNSTSYPILMLPPAISGAENVRFCISTPLIADAIAQNALRLKLERILGKSVGNQRCADAE